jgi:hypothetical protein
MKQFHTKELTCFSVIYENLLLESHPRSLIMFDGSQLYESQSAILDRYTFFDYYNEHYLQTFINLEKTPHLISTVCGSFTNLNQINYNLAIVEYLNTKGLNIYFYETIFLDTGTKRNSLTDEGQLIYSTIKNSLIGFESTKSNLANMYCFEFEKIQEFVLRNKLTNVTVYSGDYNVEKYFANLYPNLKFATQDIYLVSLFKHATDKFTSYEYAAEWKLNNDIQYKFWCGTRRYEGYRHLTVAYLLDRSALCSYQYKIEDSPFGVFDTNPNRTSPLWGELQNYLWFDLTRWESKYPVVYQIVQHGLEIIKNNSSRSIDIDIENNKSLESFEVPVETYEKCFCAVVAEARYAQPTGNFSEKTLNAIKSFRPFILVAPPHTIKYLKTYGVKTFNEFWDEEYDNEENHEKRLIKIFKVIDHIDSFTVDELKELYTKMQPILEHNYRIIKNIAKDKWHE